MVVLRMLQGDEKDETHRLLEASQQAAADLKTAMSNLQDQLNAINEQLLAAVQEKNESVRARSVAESQIVALTSSQAELKKLHDSVNEQLNAINEELLLSVQEKNECVRARTTAESQLSELAASAEEAKKQLEIIGGQLTEASNEKNSLVVERNKLQAEKDDLEERLKQLAAQKAEGEAQLGAEISQLHEKVEGLDLKADELEKRLGGQKERLEMLIAEKETAEKKTAQALSTMHEKEAALSEVQEKVWTAQWILLRTSQPSRLGASGHENESAYGRWKVLVEKEKCAVRIILRTIIAWNRIRDSLLCFSYDQLTPRNNCLVPLLSRISGKSSRRVLLVYY